MRKGADMSRRDAIRMGAGVLAGLVSGVSAARAADVDYASTGARLKSGPPAADGFSMPAEWVPHERTLMQFLPPQNWYPHQLDDARREWAAVANAVAEYEPVTMAVRRQDKATARRMLSGEIELIEFPLNDGWSRDSGPSILTRADGARCIPGFEFNGWGRKFPPYADDALAKGHFAKYLGMDIYPADLVLEGGAIAVDGEGTLITTEECLLHSNRNPGKSKSEVEAILRGWLGAERIIWLPRGLTPDPITDGHVDGIAAFAAPGVVLLHVTDETDDENLAITRQAKEILTRETDARGRRFEVIDVPLTSWSVVHMNFYICNGAVIVPVAGVADEDDLPLGIIGDAFPGRRVVPISGKTIGEGGGGIHCITQQVPAV